MLDAQQHDDSGNGRDAEQREGRALALSPRSEGSAAHGGDDLHGAEGDVEEDGVESVEAEGVDD